MGHHLLLSQAHWQGVGTEMEQPGLDVNPLHLNSSLQQLLFLLGTLPQSWWMAESGSHHAVSSNQRRWNHLVPVAAAQPHD